MTNAKLNVLFKKIQKDDKKEVLEFHVQGDELPHSEQLVGMAGSIVFIDVETSKAGKLNAEFKSIQRDSKKTTLKFNVKGDSEDKMNILYPFAGRSVALLIEPSQMSIEEFNEQHEGIQYSVEKDGTTKVNPNQMSLEDVDQDEKEEFLDNPDNKKVTEEDPFDNPDDDQLFDELDDDKLE